MSTNEFDRPPSRARRLVLRKIAAIEAGASPSPEIVPGTSSPADASVRGIALDAAAAAARLSAPAPTPGSRRPPSPSIPSFDATPGGGTPVPNRARASLPPVVANLWDPHLAAQPQASAGATRKAGLLGAAAGLVLVGVVVAGARLAHRLTPPMAVVSPAASASPAATSTTPASAAAPAVALPPQPGWTAVAKSEPAPPPVERPQPRHVVAPARAAAPTPATSAASKVSAEPPAPEGTARTAAAAGSDSATTAQPAPDDSAPSLVPVIPSSPPPEPDPLVKAILEDDHK